MVTSTDERGAFYWYLRGMRGLFSIPALILMASFVGFAAFAFEAGISRGEAMFMTFVVWALPAKMILTGMMSTGAPLLAMVIAVTLSSIRMMPMVAALVPEIRTRSTPVWILLICSHVVAVTAWVFAMQTVKNVPREHRVAYFIGFGYTLTTVNTLLVGVCYGLVAGFPPLVAGALFFLTPVYFFASIWVTSKQPVTRLAYWIGIAAGPSLALLIPGWDILVAGIGGGTLAYAIDRVMRMRKAEGKA